MGFLFLRADSLYVYPNDLGDVYWAAAAHQMADRVHEGQGHHVYLPMILRQ